MAISLLAVEGPRGRGDSPAVSVVVDALRTEAVVALVVGRRVPECVLLQEVRVMSKREPNLHGWQLNAGFAQPALNRMEAFLRVLRSRKRGEGEPAAERVLPVHVRDEAHVAVVNHKSCGRKLSIIGPHLER